MKNVRFGECWAVLLAPLVVLGCAHDVVLGEEYPVASGDTEAPTPTTSTAESGHVDVDVDDEMPKGDGKLPDEGPGSLDVDEAAARDEQVNRVAELDAGGGVPAAGDPDEAMEPVGSAH
jgi:hypothetical protein